MVNSSLPLQIRSDARVAQVFSEWIAAKRYVEPVSEEQAATDMGLSREQLAYFCSVIMGKPFRQLRKEFRIREAQTILKGKPDISLEVLGELVGIPDKSNFRRQFCEVSGCPPREWLARSETNFGTD